MRTNDVQLAVGPGGLRVVGVETGARGFLRRLLPRAVAGRVGPGAILDWAGVEPFVGHVPTVRLRVPHPKLARLHPAQIADLVESVSHGEGAELLDAIESTRSSRPTSSRSSTTSTSRSSSPSATTTTSRARSP